MKTPSTLYQREAYIERIKPFIRTNAVKVMIGHRRVGNFARSLGATLCRDDTITEI